MDIRQLNYFIALAEELNFTRAAARCQVVQSALSYQIARLEQEYSVVLFERTSRRVSLTTAGELLLPRARRIIAGLDDAQNELAELAGLVTGQLRIGRAGGDNAATARFERNLANFHRQHPGVQITIDNDNRHLPDRVRAGTIDVAVVDLSGEQAGIDLVYHSLAVEPLVAVTETDSAVTVPPHMTPMSLAKLADRGPLVEGDQGSGLRMQIDEAFARAGVTRRIALEVPETATVVRFVGMGFGSAVVPLSATVGTLNVTVQPIAEPGAEYQTGLIHCRPEIWTPAMRSFLKMLREQDLLD
jgi:DNA-binding transcriptional LysR family regulator